MHSCPECGQACYCGGDIEDHDTGSLGEGAFHCTHWTAPECDQALDDDDGLTYLLGPEHGEIRALGELAACIGCGCDDDHACAVGDADAPTGCHWLRVDYVAGLGVCSACEDHLEAWDRGDRTPHAPPAAELEAEARVDPGRVERFEQPRPPGWSLAKCPHDWPTLSPEMHDACRWCGMSFARHVFTQCP